jgi:hypothetical protein
MKRYLPFAFLGLIFLLTLLRASAGFAGTPVCLEGEGWRKLSRIEGQFLTHFPDPDRGRKTRRSTAATAPKRQGLDQVELWELPNPGPVAEPENRTAMLIRGDDDACLVSRLSGKGTGRMSISVVPLSREADAIQLKTRYWQGSVQQTTQIYTVDKKAMKFQELWSAITLQLDPATNEARESQVEYVDSNSDNYTDILLTEPEGESTLWKWNSGKKSFEIKK